MSYRGVTYLVGNLRTGARKNREPNLDLWGGPIYQGLNGWVKIICNLFFDKNIKGLYVKT